MASGRPSPQGLFWIVAAMVIAIAGFDLLRGSDSALRGWWTGLHMSRGEQARSFIEQFRDRQPRARGR